MKRVETRFFTCDIHSTPISRLSELSGDILQTLPTYVQRQKEGLEPSGRP